MLYAKQLQSSVCAPQPRALTHAHKHTPLPQVRPNGHVPRFLDRQRLYIKDAAGTYRFVTRGSPKDEYAWFEGLDPRCAANRCCLVIRGLAAPGSTLGGSSSSSGSAGPQGPGRAVSAAAGADCASPGSAPASGPELPPLTTATALAQLAAAYPGQGVALDSEAARQADAEQLLEVVLPDLLQGVVGARKRAMDGLVEVRAA